jgi:uncharacterized delta-60 repeat protein
MGTHRHDDRSPVRRRTSTLHPATAIPTVSLFTGRRPLFAAVAVAALAVFTANALAAPGDLDPSFDGDGKATVNFGGAEGSGVQGEALDVAVQPDGAVVVVGVTDVVPPGTAPGITALAVARFLPDGRLDPGFGVGGRLAQVISTGARGTAVALQPDGKILVAADVGGLYGAANQIVVVRLNADGSPDTGFGNEGYIVDLVFGPGGAMPYDIVVQADTRIVVVGMTTDGIDAKPIDFAIARFDSDGSPDTSFSGDGKQTVGFGGIDFARAVAIDSEGRIVVAGFGGVNNDMLVTRLKVDGSVDSSFGNNGVSGMDFGDIDAAEEMALQPDGKIVLAGFTTKGRDPVNPTDYAIARLETNGNPDPTFDLDGKQTIGFGGDDRAHGLAIQADGKILVGGSGGGNTNLVLTRLNADGSLDQGFGAGGVVAPDFGGLEVGGQIALQPDGRIVIAGSDGDFTVARVDGDEEPPPTTTTTLPPAVCVPTCVTSDPCRPQACVQGACLAQDVTGLAVASCACQRTPPAVCVNLVPPPKLRNAAAKACNLMNAAEAVPSGRRRTKKLVKAARKWQAAGRLVFKRPAQRVLTPECATALADGYDDAASRVAAVLQAGGG